MKPRNLAILLFTVALVIVMIAGYGAVTGWQTPIAKALNSASIGSEAGVGMDRAKSAAVLAPLPVFDISLAPFCTIDVDGANDEPGQVDLTQMCRGLSIGGPPQFYYTWSWDEITGSGSNTLDACGLYDTDSDGDVNYSLCVRLLPDANQNNRLVYSDMILYSCGDDKPDRCTQPITEIPPSASTSCSADQQTTDPFAAGSAYPQDTVAGCTVNPNDVGGVASVLINVCSFPSGEPNSNPFDCIVNEGVGFLTVVNMAKPNDQNAEFSFTISPEQKTIIVTKIMGSGTTQRYSVTPDSYSVSMTMPSDWLFVQSGCVDQSGNPVGTGTNPITAIQVDIGDDIVCTFEEQQQAPEPTATFTPTPTATYTPTPTATLPGPQDPTVTPTPRPQPGGAGNVAFSGLLALSAGLLILFTGTILTLSIARRR
jgi:hypothetical protein